MGPLSADKDRDLPTSLQGIEPILRLLSQYGNESTSMRSLSETTRLSMRVTKNILLQLEKLNQVERVIEKNQVVPKWRITKLGREVIKRVKDTITQENQSPEETGATGTLLKNIVIPGTSDQLIEGVKDSQQKIRTSLDVLQVDLSKLLGIIINYSTPQCMDQLGLLLRKFKNFASRVNNFPPDRASGALIQKMGEKKKEIDKNDLKQTLAEKLFFNSVILNQLQVLGNIERQLAKSAEDVSKQVNLDLMDSLNEEMYILDHLLRLRETITPMSHVLTPDELHGVVKNKLDVAIINRLLPSLEGEGDRREIEVQALKDVILKVLGNINKVLQAGGSQGSTLDGYADARNYMPLVLFYQLVRDENPTIRPPIELVEQIVNELTDQGYLAGIKVVEEDEDHYFKFVQFQARDFTQDENQLLKVATRLQKFTLTAMVNELNWPRDNVLAMLQSFTNSGLLRQTHSYLQGDQWYIV